MRRERTITFADAEPIDLMYPKCGAAMSVFLCSLHEKTAQRAAGCIILERGLKRIARRNSDMGERGTRKAHPLEL